MKLSKNSLAAKWYFHLTGGLPKSLCPFFWNTLLSIPLGLLFFAGFIPSYSYTFRSDTDTGKILARFALGVLVELLVGLFIMGVYFYAIAWMNHAGSTAIGTGIVLGVVGLVWSVWSVRELIIKRRRPRQNDLTPSTWQVCKVAIKSWYERNCPIIDWQE